MSDPVADWLKSLGAKSDEIHGSIRRMDFVCGHFNLAGPEYSKLKSKEVFRKLRKKLLDGVEITKGIFISDALSVFENNEKWDPGHIAFCRSKKFYSSQKWRNLRVKALAKSNRCAACGRGPNDGIVLHVDHILPRSIYPEYALKLGNLQILCEDCNMGKGNTVNKRFK